MEQENLLRSHENQLKWCFKHLEQFLVCRMYSTEVGYYLPVALLQQDREGHTNSLIRLLRDVPLHVQRLSRPVSNPSANPAEQKPLASRYRYHLPPKAASSSPGRLPRSRPNPTASFHPGPHAQRSGQGDPLECK